MRCGLVGVLALLAMTANAQVKSPMTWSVKSAPHTAVKAGAKFDVTVAGAIAPGWHLYALAEPDGGPVATQVGLADGDNAEVARVTSGKPRTQQDPSFGMQTSAFYGSAEFTLHLIAAGDAAGKSDPLHVLVRYQSCNDRLCLPPRTDTVLVPFAVGR